MHELNEFGVAAHWNYKLKAANQLKNDKVSSNWFKELSGLFLIL